MIGRARAVAAGIAVAATVGACAHRRAAAVSPATPSKSGAATCTAAVGSLPQGTNVASIAGDYQLTLVATAGPRNGWKTDGTLSLDPPARSSSPPTQLTGLVTVMLDSIGAVAPSRSTSAATAIPAVAVQWAMAKDGVQTPQITIRLATTAASTGTRMIEGSYMALHVAAIAGDGFSGRWESAKGGMEVQPASGYFCARTR